MTVHRRVPAVVGSADLPAEIAAGPDPALWESWKEWHRAGVAWSTATGLGPAGWRALLTPDVRYLTTALGRAHVRAGLAPPWCVRR